MPGERTPYRKIQVVLDYAKEGKHQDVDTLVRLVTAGRPTNFVYFYRDRVSDEIKFRYSKASVERTVHLCIDLGLLSPGAVTLNKTGLNATDPRRFATIVGACARECLGKRGVPLEAIHLAIEALLCGKHRVPPTADQVWNNLRQQGGTLDFEEFRRLMALMGQCGVLLMTQRRIYLPAST